MTDKNRALLRQFDDPANVTALLELPQKLIAIAGKTRNPRTAALLAQLAVAIEILTMAPIRLGNLCALHLEQNLVRPGRGKHHLAIEEMGLKRRQALEFPLPPQSIELLERYLRDSSSPFGCSGLHRFIPGPMGRFKRHQHPWGANFAKDPLRHGIKDASASVSTCHGEDLPQRQPRWIRGR